MAGHFLLTNLLLENMKSASRNSGIQGRIVNVSSAGHIMTYPEGICFDKLHDPSGYSFVSYTNLNEPSQALTKLGKVNWLAFF
jgi:NAD(P)-dependent dehydrogenase (short-subunit alcohol dehydrogenase family)